MENKKKYVRTCIVCRNKFIKNQLIRICIKDNELFVDYNQKFNSRSMYVCPNKICADKLINKKKYMFKNINIIKYNILNIYNEIQNYIKQKI